MKKVQGMDILKPFEKLPTKPTAVALGKNLV
jgi:hypothetical protein